VVNEEHTTIELLTITYIEKSMKNCVSSQLEKIVILQLMQRGKPTKLRNSFFVTDIKRLELPEDDTFSHVIKTERL
jgi:hypothetical protein